MNRTILVPLDGSVLAEQGLHAACRVATATGAGLLLLSAVPFAANADPSERQMAHTGLHDARAHLSYEQQVAATLGISARTLVLPGDPAAAILFAAEEQQVDLISMATHGRTGLRKTLLGSVAAAIVRGTRTPILLSRTAEWPRPLTASPYRRILVPLDGTPFAEAALSYVREQGLDEAAEVRLLRAVAPAPPYMGAPIVAPGEVDALARRAEEETDQHRCEAEAYLRAVGSEQLGGRPFRLIVPVAGPADAIVDAVSSDRTDLIVLATHDRHGVDRLLHGSVAQEVLQHTTAPVLLLHGASGSSAREAATSAEHADSAGKETGEPTAREQTVHAIPHLGA